LGWRVGGTDPLGVIILENESNAYGIEGVMGDVN